LGGTLDTVLVLRVLSERNRVLEKPIFLQGLFPFQGAGLENPIAFMPAITYKVPSDRRSQLVYFRAGNSSAELIYVVFKRDSKPMRYFPIGAKHAIHVSLAVVEDLQPGTSLEVLVGAPNGVKGSAVIDIGLMEI
jgi:hypothetical protein